MKKFILLSIFAAFAVSISAIPPYYKLLVQDGTIGEMAEIVRSKLSDGGFKIVGEYYPGDTDHLYVIAFTSEELISLAAKGSGAELLASVLKVGITNYDGKVTVSLTNPEYFFHAYLRDGMDSNDLFMSVKSLSDKVLKDMTFEGTAPAGFGGDETRGDLKKYKYMAGMPAFNKPVELNNFSSFEKGVEVIRKNLESEKGNTEKVYELVFDDKEVAIFGVGLYDQAKGESHFLPIIGEDHIAAMPYEIVLIANRAIILHGRFRFALHWPELKMKTFAKIMNSPGDVEDILKTLTEN